MPPPENRYNLRGRITLKTLHAYLLRQVLATLLMTVVVFTFVLLLGNVIREVLPLLVNRRADLATVGELVGLLIPFVWPFVLPMALLTAVLLVFGRFSADQELTAARASGISLLALIRPVLVLSLALCLVSAWASLDLAPRCRAAFVELKARAGLKLAVALLPEKQHVKDFDGFIFYVERNRQEQLRGVWVYLLDEEGRVWMTVRSPRGEIVREGEGRPPVLRLYEAVSAMKQGGHWVPSGSGDWSQELEWKPATAKSKRTKISDMTFAELVEERRMCESKGVDATPVLVQMHTRVAFSFACFAFALVGIPLGIRVHRRETNIGVALALVLVLLYYSFIVLGHALAMRPACFPHLIVWVPNLLFQIVGALLLWRANRGGL